ncbi:hypothetical protein STXM2123_5587 [Streptomyces sp. F-3]|nr:hypothetical protein STXM2123_5587 [Streptomyces sp. F-3]
MKKGAERRKGGERCRRGVLRRARLTTAVAGSSESFGFYKSKRGPGTCLHN